MILNIYVKDLEDKYINAVKTIDNCRIINDIQKVVPDLILFGSDDIHDGLIEHFETVEYLYLPKKECYDYMDCPWVVAVWQPMDDMKLFVFRFERLLKHMLSVKQLEINNIFLDAVINLSPNMIWFKDLEGRHLLVNDAFRKMCHKDNKDIVGKHHNDIWGLSEEQKILGKCICTDSDVIVSSLGWAKTFDEQLTLPDGAIREMFTHKAPLRNKYGHIVGTFGIAEDVTVKKIQAEKLQHAVSHDYLTDVYNRQFFIEEIGKLNNEAYTIYFCDLDNFKKMNDAYGHQLGDRVIVLFATILTEVFPNAIVARYGGDEFVVAQRGNCVANEIKTVMSELDKKMRKVTSLDGRIKDIAVSIGVCQHNVGENIDKIISFADVAMYQAKAIHKNPKLAKEYDESLSKVFYKIAK